MTLTNVLTKIMEMLRDDRRRDRESRKHKMEQQEKRNIQEKTENERNYVWKIKVAQTLILVWYPLPPPILSAQY